MHFSKQTEIVTVSQTGSVLTRLDSNASMASTSSEGSSARDSGYSSDESIKPIPRRHKHKRSKHLIRLERELGELPTLPSSFLSANPCLSQAMNVLRRQARHISNESRELVREPEVAEPPCLDCRFERAVLFSGLAAEDAPLSPGLREALALIRSD